MCVFACFLFAFINRPAGFLLSNSSKAPMRVGRWGLAAPTRANLLLEEAEEGGEGGGTGMLTAARHLTCFRCDHEHKLSNCDIKFCMYRTIYQGIVS